MQRDDELIAKLFRQQQQLVCAAEVCVHENECTNKRKGKKSVKVCTTATSTAVTVITYTVNYY